jgi:hypothetical protein
MKKLYMTVALSGLLATNHSSAGESYLVYSPQDIGVFQVRFFDVGDGPFIANGPQAYESRPGTLISNRKTKYLMPYVTGLKLSLPGQSNCPPLLTLVRLMKRMRQVTANPYPLTLSA